MRNTFFTLLALIASLCTTSLVPAQQEKKQLEQPRATRGEQPGAQRDQPRAGTPGQSDQQRTSGQSDQQRATTSGQSASRDAASRDASTRDAGSSAAGSTDQQIAAYIHGAAHNEIELAKFAQQKVQNEQVKRFAQKMVQEHQPGCDAMKQLAGSLASHDASSTGHGREAAASAAPRREGDSARSAEGRTNDPNRPAEARATDSNRPAEARTGDANRSAETRAADQRTAQSGRGEGRSSELEATAHTGASSRGILDWVQIHKEFGAKCLASTKEELSQKSSPEAEKCFMGHQVSAHMKMVGELEVLQNFAGGELKQKIGEELKMAKAHLQEAKQIMEQIKDKPDAERVTRNPTDSSKK